LCILKLQAFHGIAETIKKICFPLKIFKVNTDEIKVMTCISLSMIPILKKNLYEIKEACISKKINFNIRNMKIILTKFFLSLLARVNEIEESLKAKGYSNE
jgi:energy-coupling factor transporter transmembrane protein EcfT